MNRLLVLALSLLVSAVAAQEPQGHLDAQGRAMLDPLREQALRPREVIARLRLAPNAVVADVGAGPGFWSVPLAKAVPNGSVLALDVRADYLAVAVARARQAGVANLRTRVIPPGDAQLGRRSVDLVLLAQVDQYLEDRASYFASLASALRPGGRLVIINYERFRSPDVAAAQSAKLRVVDEWQPSPPFFVLVLAAATKE